MSAKAHVKKVKSDVELGNRILTFLQGETFPFIIGTIMAICSLYLLLSFISYFFTGANDQSLLLAKPINVAQIQNYAGVLGARSSEFFINKCFGVSAFFIPVIFIIIALRLMRVSRNNTQVYRNFIVCALLMIWSSIFLGFMVQEFNINLFFQLGGCHGYNVSSYLIGQIGNIGMWLLFIGTTILILIYFTNRTVNWIRRILRLEIRKQPVPTAKDEAEQIKPSEPASENNDDMTIANNTPSPTIKFKITNNDSKQAKATIAKPVIDTKNSDIDTEIDIPDFDDEDKDAIAAPVITPYDPKLDLENYHYPTLGLLTTYGDEKPAIDKKEQNDNKNKIISTLRSFGIEICDIQATVGPAVTLYEITPEAGVRISKIRGLEDDIALSLSARGIRIIAPIPGKGTIGIEVPNANPQIVSMHSIIASQKFQESKYDLPIALGKTITNDVFMVDLCKMPHVLVAGATGQGKSVGLNAIITSLLYKKHPSELKFVLVDPKKVEFSLYNSIENHFLAKLPGEEEAIITDFTKVVQTLNSLCTEMDSRYDLLKKAHVRNIKEYNTKFIARKLNPEHGHKFMPYIVVIIDEFGDLIMTAGKEVELPIARIAQLARAVGIHMIIATQRPTTNIITGTIKANFPARIAFRVSSMMDSRTILDRPGANHLIGHGDMLFLQGNDPVRVQCAFVDTPEVEKITEFISNQQGYAGAFELPEYVGNNDNGYDNNDMNMSKVDDMFEDAARLIVIHQQGSTSLIQRKFSIGYNRAGRIMDQLERAGIVGPAEGSKPRQVLCDTEDDLQIKLNNIKQ